MATDAPAGIVGIWLDDHTDEAASRWLRDEVLPAWEEAGDVSRVDLFLEVDGTTAMALASLDDASAARRLSATSVPPDGSGVQQASFTHGFSNVPDGSGEFGDTPYLFVVRVFTPDEWVTKFRSWLHEEHFVIQPKTPGLTFCHGYEATSGAFHFLNMWAIEAPGVPDSEEYLAIRDTPWFAEISPVFGDSELKREIYRPATKDELGA